MICWNRDDGQVYKARVALGEDRVAAWEHQPDGQPNMTVDEFHECDATLRQRPARDRGAGAPRDHRAGPRPDRHLGLRRAPRPRGPPRRPRRLGRRLVPQQQGSSPYANPVTGLHFVVDLNRMELLEIEDDAPRRRAAHDGRVRPPPRARASSCATTSSRCEVIQPEGVSFTLDGNALRWQKWSLRVGFNHREGMVLHTVGYDGALPVAHRLSFAEMVVPYRDPTTDHYRRTAFDIGEWGLGFMTTSLELGCDCLGEIAYLDAVMHDTRGEPYAIPQRDLHPRGGRRRPVEARRRAGRRRGAPLAPAGALLPRHRRELRVPRLLALLPGRQHRVRGARDRDHGHDALRRRASSRPTGRSSTSAPTRRSTSTSSSPASTSTSTARPTRSTRASPRRSRSGPTTPTASRSSSATRRCAPSRRASRTTTGRASAPGRSSTRT